MGRSSASCFKIIACGSDSVDHDDLQSSEDKVSSDKRGWSFRKRSARHRVLSNTVIAEVPPPGNKESPESAVLVQAQSNSTVPEKASTVQWTDEKTELSTPVNSKSSENIDSKDDDTRDETTIDESIVVSIQTAIRGFLAQRILLKHQNVIKLQAAVRGHLVRRHAVGTLRCVQAIVKMQLLVRAHQARRLMEGLNGQEKEGENYGENNQNPTISGKDSEAKTQTTYSYTSLEKLLSNSFARQLMESTPRTKRINIKCDPLKSDSAWGWLERWMSVSPMNREPTESELPTEQQKNESLPHSDDQEEVVTLSKVESTDVKTGIGKSAETSGNDDLVIPDAVDLGQETCRSHSPSFSQDLDLPEAQNIDESNSRHGMPGSIPVQEKHSDLTAEMVTKPVPPEAELDEQRMLPVDECASQPCETEAKKSSLGSRKASNPAFIAAQSKFEELSSATNSAKLTSSSIQDPGVECSPKLTSSSIQDPGVEPCTKKISSTVTDESLGSRGGSENSMPHGPLVQFGGSECGTELSITSTLVSPERSEVGNVELEQGHTTLDKTEVEQGLSVLGKVDDPESKDSLGIEANGESNIVETDLSATNGDQLESICYANAGPDNSMAAPNSQSDKDASEPAAVRIELESDANHPAYNSSPEASPRSHVTIPESQATPSSQVHAKSKKIRSEKSDSNRKSKSSSSGKKSSHPNQDSGVRSSLEQLPKDHKSGKRRNSFGSAKSDHVDQEPRESSSTSSLPSYMQATESARAKAIANNSPRSSPDVQEKEIHLKKRQSLSGGNGRQGSPRIQRSMSQVHQTAKGNGTPPQDRKWRR